MAFLAVRPLKSHWAKSKRLTKAMLLRGDDLPIVEKFCGPQQVSTVFFASK
jgi:hypothetical protein